ncbi:MAG: hypothetical protein AAB289_00680, partial [Chloroflexota bacterium]
HRLARVIAGTEGVLQILIELFSEHGLVRVLSNLTNSIIGTGVWGRQFPVPSGGGIEGRFELRSSIAASPVC